MPKSNKIYLDYASATPIEPAVLSLMHRIYKKNFASPNSIHELGDEAKKIVENSKREVAKILEIRKEEIIFTGGSTEANNIAIKGLIFGSSKKKLHLITSNIEHSSLLDIFKSLEKGFSGKKIEVTYIEADPSGIVDPGKIKKALRPDTLLVSVMYANSEIGTINAITNIAKEIRHYNKFNNTKIFFHTDATQAVNYLEMRIPKLGVDMLSLSSSKFYGPKGVGMLYVKNHYQKYIFDSFVKSKNTDLPAIAGFTRALLITQNLKDIENKRLLKIRDYFFSEITKLSKKIFNNDRGIILNGDLKKRLSNNVNITIPNIPSDLLVIELSARGIMVSSKSACREGDGKASHVIKAINKNFKDTDGSLRFSLGRYTTKADIDNAIKALSQILFKLKKWYH